MIDRRFAIAGIAVLALAWAGPLPRMVEGSFAAHMALHMSVVGIGVPLLAAGTASLLQQKGLLRSQLALPIIVSLVDFVVVWGWHAPALHHASRTFGWALALEQASFAIAAYLVWVTALAGEGASRGASAMSGAMTLFFTSMHMTLLGALISLAPRPIFGGHHTDMFGLSELADQQLGGVIMLAIGGVIYLAGGIVLMGRVLRRAVPS